jgi:hypothetical protein
MLYSCGEWPFTYEYKSPIEVDIIYKGVTYSINSISKTEGLPFEYEFEKDGDLNLTLDGRTYEIESPYDLDNKAKKKKVKKKVKKKSKKTSKKTK